ncbi:unnamed protein product [Ilex paraguariensis]|uniref:Uncharacterized protein n=1 Tax=Ilex paraguariensis TaxID=185542 RepID=A0ABC8R655_9AQUA
MHARHLKTQRGRGSPPPSLLVVPSFLCVCVPLDSDRLGYLPNIEITTPKYMSASARFCVFFGGSCAEFRSAHLALNFDRLSLSGGSCTEFPSTQLNNLSSFCFVEAVGHVFYTRQCCNGWEDQGGKWQLQDSQRKKGKSSILSKENDNSNRWLGKRAIQMEQAPTVNIKVIIDHWIFLVY